MRAIIIDANLLLVYIVGCDHPERLGKAKHLKEYMPEDYGLLVSLLERFDQIVITPNVVTECSNLLGDSHEHDEAKRFLKRLVESAAVDERYVASERAVAMHQYWYLGVADCSLLNLVDGETVLVTMDGKLAHEALQVNQACINFNHLRDFRLKRA